MDNTARTSLIGVAALVIGGLVGYGYNASLPVSVTSTDVTTNAPLGDATLAHARSGIFHLDRAAAAVGKGNLDKAANELTDAKTQFTDVASSAPKSGQPILVAQEAVIVHQFSPSRDYETVGAIGTHSADAAGMALTKGRTTKPLALSDYSISFGDLSVETQLASSHIDLAIKAAKEGKKALAEKEIRSARGDITFDLNSDNVGEA